MIEVGTILQSRYRIEKHIGQGGMGKVYVATDERFKSTVAIKETVFDDKNLRKAFEREARLLNSLRHPALPRVSDHFNEDDGQFLVMEFIAGEDLAEMMERNGEAFSIQDVLNWANQLCDALDYLHSQDIIHRDIKPQNLKLTPGGQIVLLDFGLAKGNAIDANHQTAAKSIFGYSRSYASLEQIQGTGTEPRSDLYSLSATLYHLLTGIPPADALTRAMNVLNGQPDPLISANLINKKVPVEIAAILQKTMALNASERPESSATLRLMLEETAKQIDFASLESIVTEPFPIDYLNQNTKTLSAATALTLNQSHIETKLLADKTFDEKSYKTRINNTNSDSKVTFVNPQIENTKSARPGRKLSAAAFSSLLLVGTGISAIFLYDASVPRTITNSATTNNEVKGEFVNTIPNTGAPLNKESANVNTGLETKVTSAKNSDKQIVSKSVVTTKNNAKETKNQSENKNALQKPGRSKDESEEVIVNDESIVMEDMTINENGIKLKNPPRTPIMPAKPYKGLSPKQLRLLERLKNKKKRVIIVETPEPKPTP